MKTPTRHVTPLIRREISVKPSLPGKAIRILSQKFSRNHHSQNQPPCRDTPIPRSRAVPVSPPSATDDEENLWPPQDHDNNDDSSNSTAPPLDLSQEDCINDFLLADWQVEDSFDLVPEEDEEVSSDDSEISEPASDNSSIGCCNSLALTVSPIKPSRRRVRFSTEVVVANIPSHRVYTPEEKATMWTSLTVLRAEARRNTVEWFWEGCDMKNVAEEDEFQHDHYGNVLHPAHLCHNTPFYLSPPPHHHHHQHQHHHHQQV